MPRAITLRSILRSCRLPVLIGLVAFGTPTRGPAGDDGDAAGDPSKAVVRGIVVDETGTPIGGATVSIPMSASRGGPPPATTTEDGRFQLTLNAPVAHYTTLIAHVADGTRQALLEIHESDAVSVDVRLTLKPSRRLQVQVVDADGGPAAGARVGVIAHYHPIVSGIAGADGSAVVQIPADAEVDWVFALQPAVGFDYFENYHAFPTWGRPVPPESITLTLRGTRTVEVKVVDGRSQPVAGLAVTPWSIQTPGKLSYVNLSGLFGEPLASARTDATGIAHFDFIPAEIENGVTFLVHHDEYHCPMSPNLLPEDHDKQLVATVYKNGRVSGRVTHADGAPAAGILVQGEGRGATSHYFRGRARTDRDGRYSLSVYPDQTYILAAIDGQLASESHVGFHVAEGQQLEGLDFVLGPGIVIRGRATVGPDSKPAVGETVTLIQQTSAADNNAGPSGSVDLVRWAKTDDAGQYEIRVGPGSYRLKLPNTEQYETLSIAADVREPIVRDVHAPRKARGELRGTVVDSAGRPLVNAEVYGESIASAGHAGFNTVTRETGEFVTDRWRDEMLLYARSADGRLAGAVEIDPDADTATLTLAPAGSITGRVIGADGQPLPGVRVTCNIEAVPGANRGTIHLNSRTDPRGFFEFRGLAQGAAAGTGAYYGPQFDYASGPRVVIEGAGEVDVGVIRVNAVAGE